MATNLILCLSRYNQFLSPTPTLISSTRFPQSKNFPQKTSLANLKPQRLICAVSSQFTQITDDDSRRSANYQPNLWNFEFLPPSLENDHKVILYICDFIYIYPTDFFSFLSSRDHLY